MKTKQNVDSKVTGLGRLGTKSKPKSLKPMRSMVATRSLKPKTLVATLAPKFEENAERN
jgi:hypothetical protein